MYNVRKAIFKDIPDIVYMGYRFLIESGYINTCGFNVDDAVSTARSIINTGILLILEKENRMIGMIGGVLSPYPWNKNKIAAAEIAWWVKPEERGNRGSILLVDKFEKEAINMGATQINLHNILAMNGDKIARFYEKRGYQHLENTFSKEI